MSDRPSQTRLKRSGIRRRRFCRFLYAALTFFAVFAVVVAFFHINTRNKANNSTDDGSTNEDSELLQWIYVFHGSPLVGAWFLVYFGDVATFCNLKRLRRVHNFKYNLLIASLLAGIFYTSFFWNVLDMKTQGGAKLVEAIIIAQCELCLIGVHVYEEQEIRRERHARKKLLRERKALMISFQHPSPVPGGMI